VRRGDVDEVFEIIFAAVRSNLTTLPLWMEREFAMEPRQVEQISHRSDQVLAQIRTEIEDKLSAPGEVRGIATRQKRLDL
jgi:hypothetical protein